MPFFSVIIPLYNKDKYIENTVNSVINQTYKDFEIIIINDGSTDNSLNIIKSFTDNRIQIINKENQGLCSSRNVGIKMAKGYFIAFLDADDLWMEDFLQTIYNLIKTYKEYKVYATNVRLLFPHNVPNLNGASFNTKHELIIKNYFEYCKNILGPSSLVIHNEVFKKVGYFDESINYGEEDDFYIRCFMKFNLIYFQEPKTYYRTGLKDQLTAPNKSFRRKIPDYEKYLKNSNHKDLKKFLDFVHYKLVVLFKTERNNNLVNYYKNKINTSNLTTIQKIKYHLPTMVFYKVKSLYIWFSRTFIHC